MAAEGTIEEFKFLTLEELHQLPVFPESPAGDSQVDGGAPAPGYVYLILEEKTTASGPTNFKVGQTVNPSTCLSNLQTGNPRKLEMDPREVTNMDGAEGDLLNAMKNYKSPYGGGTEWFTVQPNQIPNFKGIFTRIVNKYKPPN